jgi:hypothetical protein
MGHLERYVHMKPNVSVQPSRRQTAHRGLGFVAAISVAAIVASPALSFAATKAKVTKKAAPKSAPKAAAKAVPAAAVFKSDLPSMTVLDLSNSKNVDLASFADGKRPSLIWFWAPH